MRVQIYDFDPTGDPVFRATAELTECFPDQDDDYRDAVAELEQIGRYWTGGGAMPLTLLLRVPT